MIAAPAPDLVTVNIDGIDLAVPKGTNVIEAAKRLQADVPHFCYHPKLSVVGNCRMCLIEMGMPAVDPATKAPVIDPATGKQKINWIPRPQIGCGTTVSPGLHVKTKSPMVKEAREGVMEFLLINHPLDCPICDQAGECKLQEQATGYGRGYSRFIEEKNVKPKRTQLGPRVTLDDERCILCSRCIRFSKEIAKDDVLGFVDRGSYSTLTCHPGKKLENNYSLNTVDICPVGALTSTDFRFKMRVWFLKQTASLDFESSAGVNTLVWSREGVIHRITPRQNDQVNDTWMADSGRLLYKAVTAPERLTTPTIKAAATSFEQALSAAAALLKAAPGAISIVGSGRATVEEHYALRQLATTLGAQAHLVARTATGDGLLISADRNPNVRGALVTGLIAQLPCAELKQLSREIDDGKVTVVLTHGEDLLAAGLSPAQLAKVKIIALGTQADATTALAEVVIPTLHVYEKSGCFINQQFRIQKFLTAVPAPAAAASDLAVFSRLAAAFGAPALPAELAPLWAQIAAAVPALAHAAYRTLPETGLLLDATPWAALPFVETASLHFKPAAVQA
jgi:NADH-quinone oxidoreductase subunit G